jgi:hypothetical protein
MFPGARRKAYFIAAPKPKTYGLSLFQETPPEDFIFANIMYPASRAFIRYVAERIAAAVYRWFCPGRNINHRGDDYATFACVHGLIMAGLRVHYTICSLFSRVPLN